MRKRTLAAAALVAVIVSIAPAFGHVMPMTGSEMVYDSKYVVVATVVDQSVARVGAAGLIETYGTARMQYRSRSFGGSNVNLTASAQRAAGTVKLDWGGDTGPYDVERSTTPWFANPVFVYSGQFGTTYQDPVLNDGATIYYYRAR